MAIADTHGKLMQKVLIAQLAKTIPDVVFFLGDVFYSDIEAVMDCKELANIPKVGIIGNHDSHDILKEFGIGDLHLKTTEICGYKVGGFGGSIKYKDDISYLMYTNKQSEEVLANFEPCDILITHDKPCFKKPLIVHAHSGLTGIAKYIERCEPKYVLHGHVHDRNLTYFKETAIRCCYNVETIELPDRG